MVLLNNRLASSAEENSNYDWYEELARVFSDRSTSYQVDLILLAYFLLFSLVRTKGKV